MRRSAGLNTEAIYAILLAACVYKHVEPMDSEYVSLESLGSELSMDK
ncbi:MAG: hypothetical protein QW353_08510 [Candidatus Korarchaeum sp.]